MKVANSCLFLLFFSLSATPFQCDEDEEPLQPTGSYEACCGTSPVEFTIGQGKVYVPNVFTVNADGINDLFLPFFNSHVSKIEHFEVFVGVDEMFHVDDFNLQDPTASAWDGSTPKGKHAGVFEWAMIVTDDTGVSQAVGGMACSILCDSAAVIFETKKGCFFPVQENGTGGVDGSTPTYEDDCFGQ